jgi:hypothetical protein
MQIFCVHFIACVYIHKMREGEGKKEGASEGEKGCGGISVQ